MPDTAIWDLRFPSGTDNAFPPEDIQALAEDVDPKLAPVTKGLLAARPAFGKTGQRYYATDTGLVYLDIGTAWITEGDTLPPASVTDSELVAAAIPYSAYRTLLEGGGSVFGAEGGMTAGVYVVSRTGGPVVSSGADPGPIALAAYLDDADFPSLGSKSPRLRLRGQLYTNSIAPGTTITFGLYPISSVAGSGSNNSTTLGAVVAGSTVAFAAPGANSLNQGASSEFAMPADGHYALGVALAGTIAANARAVLSLQLQLHWI